MKILKILLVLLVPAFGFVSCEKSGLKPGCGNHSKSDSNSDSNTNDVSGKYGKLITNEGNNDNGGSIVGSGDDDRDGGDKPKKVGR